MDQKVKTKDDINYYELVNMAVTHPVKFYVVSTLIKLRLYKFYKSMFRDW